MAVSGLGKDTGDVYRLMSPGIMGKVLGTRTAIVGDPSREICCPTRSVGFRVASGQVGADRCRAVRQDEERSWTRTMDDKVGAGKGGRREDDGKTTGRRAAQRVADRWGKHCP